MGGCYPVQDEHQATARSRSCSAVPQMRAIGLRALAPLCEQAYGNADAMLLNSYDG